MYQGFIKAWRASGMEELRMPDVQFKVWMLLQYSAVHANYHDLKPGQIRTSYRRLQDDLMREDHSIPSETTIRAALKKLTAGGYIEILNEPGRSTVITILRWSDMQGKHPEGHTWIRGPIS